MHYHGRSYRFSIGGLGRRWLRRSRMDATGTVYNLHQLNRFLGAYGSAPYGDQAVACSGSRIRDPVLPGTSRRERSCGV